MTHRLFDRKIIAPRLSPDRNPFPRRRFGLADRRLPVERLLHFDLEIRKHVHIVDKGIVGRFVRIEIGMYVPVRQPLGRHIIEMIRSLHEVPHVVEIGILQPGDLIPQGIQFSESFVLQFVAQPRRDVTFLVRPRHHVRTMEYGDGLVFRSGFAHRSELQPLPLQNSRNERLHKVENTRIGTLVLAEGFVIHEEIDHIPLQLVRSEPPRVFFRRERPLVPPSVGETERDVVRELVIAQQQPQALVERIGINIAGRLPSQYVSGSLGQHGLETHLGHIGADPVGIDQFGIAKGGRRNAELLFHQFGMERNLLHEILLRRKRSQRMGVSFGQELHAARPGQAAERIEHLGRIRPHLFDGQPRQRKGTAETPLALPDQIEQQGIHRQIALTRDLLHDRAIGQVVQVVVVTAHIEETVTLQPPGLVYLKIETNRFHTPQIF